jgi:outer membrane protein TolC
MRNDNKNKIAVLAALLCIFTQEFAFGDTLNLSLKEALTRAMRDNPLVRIERINTDISALILKENRYLVYEPQVEISYQTNKSDNGADFFDKNDTKFLISQTFPTGTGINLSKNIYHTKSSLSGTYADSAKITVTQALLRGVNPVANLVPLRKAKLDVEIRDEELSAYVQKLFADIERAYWNTLLSGEEIKIYQYSLELANRLLYESQERLKIGSVAAIDLAAIVAEVASRERQLFDAESAYRQNVLYLAYLMNAPGYWNANITLTDTTLSLGEADSEKEHLDAAKKFRQDYRMARLLAQKGELDLIQTRDGLLPRLDFFISLQGYGAAKSFGDAFTAASDKKNVTAGLILQFPLTNGVAREKYHRVAYSSQQQKLSVENFERLIEYEIRAAHIDRKSVV